MRLTGLGEFGLIERIRRSVKNSARTVIGIGDDAAVVSLVAGQQLLLTTDMLVEGVHFTKDMTARLIGRKAMNCSVSDIAAMGGIPRFALISLAVPGNLETVFVDDLFRGLREAAAAFALDIVGGDTVRNDKIVINVALTGEGKAGQVVSRGGAKPGDQILVTGPLGGSLTSGGHLKFLPRVKEARYLVEHFLPTAMIDVSDGLASDLGHILAQSKVGAVIEESAIPLRKGAIIDNALYDGEDFELIFTLAQKPAAQLLKTKTLYHFYRIGEIQEAAKGYLIKKRYGRCLPVENKSYKHF
ncbi:MAG: thiamine-monophosphate kinase [Candidatus Omnitrophica bacterium]|nr:thiamine-monophosphate kinase [Candidatus Omnitrophota bacterium]